MAKLKKLFLLLPRRAFVTSIHRSAAGPQPCRRGAPSGPGYPAWGVRDHAAAVPPGAPARPRHPRQGPESIPERRVTSHCADCRVTRVPADCSVKTIRRCRRSSPSAAATVRSCSVLHYPNVQGTSSNGGVAGPAVSYLLHTWHDSRSDSAQAPAIAQGERPTR